MPFFARVFRSRDSSATKKSSRNTSAPTLGPAKPVWTDAWQRTEVAPEEVQDLIRGCTQELKARDPSAARTFIRSYFNHAVQKGSPLVGDSLSQELRLTEPMVLCSVLKWCWSRLPGGVVTWEAYELFKVGEQDSQLARDAFSTFIPISVDSDARTKIIFDFFDLLSAIAAHGKSNGLGGRKLSRYAGWWAFEHADTGNGFEYSYRNWTLAADATSHLFFAYLRSLSPDLTRGVSGVASLPIALQTLLQATEYPPETPVLLQISTTKIVMIVDTVSPTPFALLRRAKNFEYPDRDSHLQEFAGYEDPVRALTDECVRVLRCISSANLSIVSSSKTSTSLRDASWSRFEDIGFSASIDSDPEDEADTATTLARTELGSLRSAPHSVGGDLGRPTTPSWADFMSSGFAAENGIRGTPPLLLPPDKVLPPITTTTRGQSSQSHKRTLDEDSAPEPGELASITTFDLDDSFWWVWISSLAGEETAARKAVFGRCALIETVIRNAKWLVLEEQIKGAAVEPDPEAYIVEKKRFFAFTSRRNKLSRRKSSAKQVPATEEPYKRSNNNQAPLSKTNIAPDQHARIQAAAAALQKKHREEQELATRRRSRGPPDDVTSTKTYSVMTLQPAIINEASQALKWASNYDKNAYRTAYLSDNRAGTGTFTSAVEPPTAAPNPPMSPASSKQAISSPPPPPQKDQVPVSPPQSPPSEKPTQKEVSAAPAADVKVAMSPTTTMVSAVPAADAASEKDAPPTEVVTSVTSNEEPALASPAVESPSTPKHSTIIVADGAKKLKKKPVNTGFKMMFANANKKKTEQQQQPVVKPTGAETSAVALARAALEEKARSSSSASLQKKPTSAAAPAAATTTKPAATPAAAKATAEAEKPSATFPTPAERRAAAAAQAKHRAVAALDKGGNPPRTRQAIATENDDLSRIGTNERAAADAEFSRFDQGPLVEQPAFAPADSPVEETFANKKSTEGAGEPSSAEAAPAPASEASTPTAASYERWAQIRKNAAERAASRDESGSRLSQTDRTEDGDTSGEETIESRVARIKARVAELTGNMEAAR